VAFFPLRLVP